MTAEPTVCCRGFSHARRSRRTVLQAGALGMLGLTQADLLAAERTGRTRGRTAR